MMAAGLLTATSAMAIGSQDNNNALIQDATTSNETAPKAAQPKKSNSNDYEKWRIGSYGEMLATFKGLPQQPMPSMLLHSHSATISTPPKL